MSITLKLIQLNFICKSPRKNTNLIYYVIYFIYRFYCKGGKMELVTLIAGVLSFIGVVCSIIVQVYLNNKNNKIAQYNRYSEKRKERMDNQNKILQYAQLIVNINYDRESNYEKFISSKIILDYCYQFEFGVDLQVKLFISTLSNMLTKVVNGYGDTEIIDDIFENIKVLRRYFYKINSALDSNCNVFNACETFLYDEDINNFREKVRKYEDDL